MRNLLGLLLILIAAMSAGWQAHDWHDTLAGEPVQAGRTEQP